MPRRVRTPARRAVRATPGRRKAPKINVWKVLGVAFRKRNIGLAMRVLGMRRQVRGITRAHLPQTSAARRQIKKLRR